MLSPLPVLINPSLPILLGSRAWDEVPEDNTWLSPQEQALFERLKTQTRRQHHRLGRWTAKQLICETLQLLPSPEHLQRIEIIADKDGAPWAFLDGTALDLNLSISHRKHRALSAISPSSLHIGCDIEWIEPRSQAFVSDFFTPEECQNTFASGQFALMANLIWSAKESTLKAQRVGLSRDTKELCVKTPLPFPPNPQQWHPLSVTDLVHSTIYHGAFIQSGGFILTFSSNSPKPLPLIP